jgi:hypothetical protein
MGLFICMGKDPAFLFYSSDFLNGVADLTMEERGQYITLLCLQHQKGSLTQKTIRLSVGSVSVDVMSKFTKDQDGNFYQQRLREEIEKRANFTESRRNNGFKGGRPKANGKPNGYAKDNLMEDENINEDVNKNINKIKVLDQLFEQFWDLYDYKKSKDKAEKVWRTLTNDEKVQAINHAPLYAQSTPDKTFRKHPTTYLNQKSFNDEIIERTITTNHKPNASERRFNALASLHYVQNGGEDI